jgi:PleD family two-component response regulator
MSQNERHYTRPPIALIVTGQEWVSLSVETLFAPRGYAVLRAFSGAQALQRINDFEPDLIVADQDLRDMPGAEFCRLLAERSGGVVTPVLLIATNHWAREDRLDALRAGAWDTCALPMDGEELFLRADAWVRAKLSADQARDQGLLDAATGFYNAQGLLRRISEVAASAGRRRAPLACVVIASEPQPETAPATSQTASWTHSVADRIRAAGRASDTIGRLSETEFVVLAPDTDSAGAAGLAHRYKQVIETGGEDPPLPLRVRFGCYAVRDFRDASIAPSEMLIRAAEALRTPPANDDYISFFTPSMPGAN